MKLTTLMFALATVGLTAFGQATTSTPAPRRLVCLFLDMNSMRAEDQAKAQAAAMQFIEQEAAPTDIVQIATYTSKLKVLQEFTDNHESLLAALRAIVPSDPAAISANMGGRLEAIQAATASLARFPERKALVYFASGSPSNQADQTELKNAISAAIRANVAIYAVDPSGLPTTEQ